MIEGKHVVMSAITGKFQIPLFEGEYHTVFGVATDRPYIKALGGKWYLTDKQKDEINNLQKERGKVLTAFNSLF